MKQRRVIQASARRVWFIAQRKREEAQADDLSKDPLINPKTLPTKLSNKH